VSSSFVDMGWYVRPDGRRKLLTWWADGAVTLDGPGGVEVLGYLKDEERARQVFVGYDDEDREERPIAWVHARMLAAATEDGVGCPGCPDCGGTGRRTFRDPFSRGALIEAVCPTCTRAVTR
jgi:hypothetical protein